MIKTVVAARNDLAAHGIAGPLPEATFSFNEIAGILVQKNGEQRLGHHVADGLIGEGATIIFGDTFGPLSEGVLFFGHRRARKYTGDEKRCRVEGIIERNFELLFSGQRLGVGSVFIRSVVRNYPKDVILARLLLLAARRWILIGLRDRGIRQ